MMYLTLRTDKPEAEIGLFQDGKQLAYETWQAHRELSVQLHQKIADVLQRQGKTLQHVDGIVGYAGPGSFTGLRIGLTVANALAYGLGVPVVAIAREDDWVQQGIARLQNGQSDPVALPEYGGAPHITIQKK